MKLAFNSFIAVTATVFALGACDNKPADPKPDDPSSKNSTATGATQTAATPVVPPTVISENDLATPADFEETAEKAISKATYKTELASLETDIAKD